MSEFWTACTTCQARLKVRDASLIGQIVACPKCGSMVLVTAPHGSTPAQPAQPVQAPAGAAGKPTTPKPHTEFTLDDLNDLLEGKVAPPVTPKPEPPARAPATTKPSVEAPSKKKSAKPSVAATPPNVSASTPSAAATSPPAAVRSSAAVTPSKTSAPPPATEAAAVAAQRPPDSIGAATEAPSAATADSTDTVTAPSRSIPQPVILGAAALAGLLLAAIVFYVVPRWLGGGGASDEQSVAQKNPQTGSSQTSEPQNNSPPTNTPTPPTPDDKTKAPNVDNEKPAGPAATPSPEKPTSPPVVPTPEKKPDNSAPPAEKPDKAPGEEPSKTPPVNPKPPAKPDALPGPPELTPAAKGAEGPDSLEPVGGKFAQLISGVPAPAEGAMVGKPPEEAPSEVPVITTSDSPELLRPRMRDVDVPARLADPLASVEFANVALADYLQILSDLSTLPITLDVDALMLRQLSPATPVVVKLDNTTVRDAINQALEPLKLGYTAADGHVVVSHPTASDGTLRKRTYDVADLVAKDARTSTTLPQWILELVEPDTWTEAGGRGTLQLEGPTLTVEQSDAAHLEIILLLDRLRTARKLPPRGKFPPALLAPDSLPTRAQTALQTPLSLNYARPTRLTQIFERFGRVAGVRLVVDWRSLADSSWPPETTATITVEKRTLAETLTQLLGPRDLTYRVIDDTTILITTPTAVARHLEWEFHSIPEPKSDDYDPAALIERIRDRVGTEYFRDAGGLGSLYYDGPSHCLLVALPQPQQRQVAALLKDAAQSNAAADHP